MELRAAAADATRERILEAAAEAFLERWYDDITLAEVAKRAGVSGQTVINHFGGKEALAAATYERLGEQITSLRYTPEPGDVAGLVEALMQDYERTGDAVIRLLALEERVPSLQQLLGRGRESHRDWVEEMFLAPDLVPELVVATDVYTWKRGRRDQGVSREPPPAALVQVLTTHHAAHPLAEGLPLDMGRRTIADAIAPIRPDPDLLEALLERMAEDGLIERTAAAVRLPSHRDALDEDDRLLRRVLVALVGG